MGKNGSNKLYVGVDLGGTNIQTGLVNASNKVVGRHKVKTRAETGKQEVFKRVVKAVEELLAQEKTSAKEIGGLGIGAPGTCNVEAGVVRNAVNLCWDELPLGKMLGQELGMPILVDNDVNVGTWGEYVAGAGQGYDDLLGVFVGTGIGGGLVLGGKLYRGHFQTAGEIGQTILHPDGQLGRRTVENYASRTAAVNIIKELILSNHPSLVSRFVDGDLSQIRSKALAEALKEKDQLAIDVLSNAARYVGVAIANVVTMLSLPCVVLGGGLTEALGETYLKWVRQAFESAVHPPELAKCRIIASKLGDDAGVIGAAHLARQRDDS